MFKLKQVETRLVTGDNFKFASADAARLKFRVGA